MHCGILGWRRWRTDAGVWQIACSDMLVHADGVGAPTCDASMPATCQLLEFRLAHQLQLRTNSTPANECERRDVVFKASITVMHITVMDAQGRKRGPRCGTTPAVGAKTCGEVGTGMDQTQAEPPEAAACHRRKKMRASHPQRITARCEQRGRT